MAEIKYLPVFAYGILRHPHNIEDDGGVNIVVGAKVMKHRLYASNGIGIALATPHEAEENDVVIGTYFEVPEYIVIEDYDFCEGFNPLDPVERNMYNRRMVEVTLPSGEKKQANMYIANIYWFVNQFIPEFHIESGMIEDKYLLALKINKEEQG